MGGTRVDEGVDAGVQEGLGRGALRVPTVVVIGGGEVGATHVRQLLRAIDAGRLSTDCIRVIDHDPSCPAGRFAGPRVQLETARWAEWLDEHLDGLGCEDHLVPYHWAPHLLVEWLSHQAARAGATVRREGSVPAQDVPYERPTASGDRALSYATWLCPPLCIEPALCPHTRGPKDWSLAADLETGRKPRGGAGFTPAEPRGGHGGVRRSTPPIEEPRGGAGFTPAELGRIVFRCLHLVYGVGTIPIGAILAARERLTEGLRRGPRRYLVATSSHCHALATVLRVEPAPRA